MNLNELLSGYLSFTGRPAATLTATEYIEFYKLSALTSNSNFSDSDVKTEKRIPAEKVTSEVSVPANTTPNVVDNPPTDNYMVSDSVEERAKSVIDERDNTVAFSKEKEMPVEEFKATPKAADSSKHISANSQKSQTKGKKEITEEQKANALAILRSISG